MTFKTLRKILIPVLALAMVGVPVGIAMRKAKKERKEEQRKAHLFTKEVAPVLQRSCIRCHGPEKQEGDLRLDTLEAALLGGKNGPAIVPGDPKKSLIVRRINHDNPKRVMPPKRPLSDGKIASIKEWIKEGAQWSHDIEVKSSGRNQIESENVIIGDAWSDSRNPITQLYKGNRLDLWSLKSIMHPVVPAVNNTSWPRNNLDAFILAKMEAADVKPAPEADKRTLARRLYFDLTGMPPSPDEMEAYLQDKSSDAYPKLVNKLLNSPNYGEHWARFWLDVVRYSDSNGFDYDEFRPQAWRFRDYVIRAFNSDKPFDQFLREQLAGDEMVENLPQTPEDQDKLIATGYLRVGPYDNSAAIFGEKDRCHMQVMSDIVETTSAAFLGMTLSCCRCHDHKVDPISQADYYRFRAFFESVVPNEELLLDLHPQQDVVQREAAAIKEKAQNLADLQDTVENRLKQATIAALPEEDRKILEGSGDSEDPEQAARARVVKKLLKLLPDDIEATFTEEEKLQREKLKAELAELHKNRSPYTAGFIATDMGKWSPKTYVMLKGDFRLPGDQVLPGVPSVFDPNPLASVKTVRQHSSGRRTALAEWMLNPENPLTARVIVNRIWQQHFGTGLVTTPNDFGFSGAQPSHPELLDWLARRFMEEGWSFKKLHRLMVTSATYRQGLGDAETSAAGMFNHQPPRRLTAEAIRDSFLTVSGRLLPDRGGPPRWPELPEEVLSSNPGLLIENGEKTRGWYPSPPDQLFVRSIYLVQKRSLRLPMFETFDLPENNLSCGQRTVSTVAPQALTLMNNEFTIEIADSLAERVKRDTKAAEGNNDNLAAAQVERAFSLALQRPPDATEKTACLELLQQHGLPVLCRALLNVNEFVYID